jgi:hypothetical protein
VKDLGQQSGAHFGPEMLRFAQHDDARKQLIIDH